MNHRLPKINKLYIEVTNFCNFRCDFCPLVRSKREKQHLDFALYSRIIDEVSLHGVTDTVGFHVVGEPMMYPHIFQAVRYAGECGLQTELTTNGSLSTEDTNRKLGALGLDRLTISLQRFGDTDHAERHAPISFEQYYKRILESVRFFGTSDFATEVVVLYMNTSTKRFFDIGWPMSVDWDRESYTIGLAKLLADIYGALGMQVSLSKISAYIGKMKPYQGSEFRINENVLVAIRPFFDWGNAFIDWEELYLSRYGYCNLAFLSLGILSSGEVVICCGDYNGDTSLGNVKDNSLTELLLGEQAQSIIHGFRHFKLVHPRCQVCLASTDPFRTFVKVLVVAGMCKIIRPGPGFAPKQIDLLAEMAV